MKTETNSIITTGISLLAVLAFFGLIIWLLYLNPFGTYSISLIIFGLILAYPGLFILYIKDYINKTYTTIGYGILAYITIIITLVAWNPNDMISKNPGGFTYLMGICGIIGILFGLIKYDRISQKTGIISTVS